MFALAIVTLTAGMMLAPRLYRTTPPALVALGCGTASAAGLALAASAREFAQFALGYGVLFGLGAGVGYILVQQGVNQTVRARSGLANGYVVSLYPLGAMIGAPLLAGANARWGLAAALAGTSRLWRLPAARSPPRCTGPRVSGCTTPQAASPPPSRSGRSLRLGTLFFLAASAGLLVLSQAAGIVRAYGGEAALAVGATTFITGAIAASRIAGGWLTDRFPGAAGRGRREPWSLAGALALWLWPAPQIAVPALAMLGMGYGFVSGLSAAAIAQYWPRNAFGQVASRLYVAWCLAALLLPVVAGWLFDRTGGYGAAVAIAGALSAAGALVGARLPRRPGTAAPKGR
ncbi:MAG: hypothetical protein RML56_11700 [Burkholderiales bacterium]|nr:hypothetical protein [Burkholderiales bacterium]